MSSTSAREELMQFEKLWRLLVERFPQFGKECVTYSNVDGVYPRVMIWTIPEVTEEYWAKVIPEVSFRIVAKVGFNYSSREVILLLDSPIIHEFTDSSWNFIIGEWWGG
jgi:hypothetical protein